MHPVKFDNGLLYEAETSYNSPFFVPLPPLTRSPFPVITGKALGNNSI